MSTHRCERCTLRKYYERAPHSFLGRLWRFHTRFCPGWRRYLQHLPTEQRETLVRSLKRS
ncbi:hypothetical protein [Desulfofustis limnaeus]|uniref:hypothetical protein n=1 Tax=Desulfofustis limnaeus TaxID=2740163 RepID=UPI0024DF7234|nr:hypothetical protein [Desulfofustis limnaeus]